MPNYYNKYKMLAQNIKIIRKQKGLTQTQLAELANTTRSYISKIEAPSSERGFSMDIFFGIADALQVPEIELLSFNEKDINQK